MISKQHKEDAKKDPIQDAISALSEITTEHLDEAGFEKLTQLYYWSQRHQGSIFMKTVGKLCGSDSQQYSSVANCLGIDCAEVARIMGRSDDK